MSEAANPSADDLQAVQRCKAVCDRVRADLATVIVGQNEVIEQVLIALLARGHALLEGMPGLAKTLLLSSLAEATGLSFRRIQCTPDLLPADVTGTHIVRGGEGDSPIFVDPLRGYPAKIGTVPHFQFWPGPLFANMVLADEIDRTPPKTQATLLDAMQQRRISFAGQVYELPEPFFVLATQSPLEQEEGGHPLPAAQLDRFLMQVKVDYPKPAEEWEIARRGGSGEQNRLAPSLGGEDLIELQRLVARLPVSDKVLGYAWALVRASRPTTPEAASFVDKWVAWGASPRGLLALLACAQARAVLHGRAQSTLGDIRWLMKPVLRHRIVGNVAAQASNLNGDRLVDILLEHVPADEHYGPPVA